MQDTENQVGRNKKQGFNLKKKNKKTKKKDVKSQQQTGTNSGIKKF